MDTRAIRILLVEDSRADARLIEEMLARAPGFDCSIAWADCMAAGLACLAAETSEARTDVVLLDLGLPESCGLATVERWQASAPARPPLVVLSGLDDEEVAVHALQSGAQDYLVKGRVDGALLVRAIRYAIERGQASEALRRARNELELRVAERTADLACTVDALHVQILERERVEQLLRQLAARNELQREAERKALTREIHDEMGQYLSALRMGVSLLGLQFGQAVPGLEDKTTRLVGMVDSTIKVVRNLVASLRPAALDMGIGSALEWLVDEFIERSGIACSLTVKDALPLDEKRATELFRIVQESLTNISRHAHASAVEIVLECGAGHYALAVRDDGVGFDPAVRDVKSFGLVGIRERALVLGGSAEIVSRHGRGTEIKVVFPIHYAAEAA